MNEEKLAKLAKEEIDKWTGPPRIYALAILFCFCYKLTRGRDIEEDFPSRLKQPIQDYQI